ncbi:MAG: uracil-DNA glycosylase [Candidatus Contendobacter sp.]
MDNDLRRQYLAALGVPLWLPRRPPAEAPVAVYPPESSDHPSLSREGNIQDRLLSVPKMNGEEPEPLSPDDWTLPMDDDRESLTRNAAAEITDLSPAAPNRRAATIGQMDWETLVTAVRECTACGLCASRTQTVFGVGDHRAEWLVIGEAPGADEDRIGEPFVGRAGKLLNPMLLTVGLKREQAYVANILKCRPPENRDPTPEEAAQCRPFLNRQIALIRPRLILAVGRIAAQNLLATDTPIGKLRGQVHRFGPARIPLVVTYHPAYLLRSPREKRKAWDDLRLARRALAAEPPAPTQNPVEP